MQGTRRWPVDLLPGFWMRLSVVLRLPAFSADYRNLENLLYMLILDPYDSRWGSTSQCGWVVVALGTKAGLSGGLVVVAIELVWVASALARPTMMTFGLCAGAPLLKREHLY